MASDDQIQNYVNTRIRPASEASRDIVRRFENIQATIGDIYDSLNNSPTWTDKRTDGVPHLLTPNDVLADYSFFYDTLTFMKSHPSYPIVLKSVVND